MEEDPLLIEVKREEEDFHSTVQEEPFVQNPFDGPSICGLATSGTSNSESFRETAQDARKPRKKIVPLRPGCALQEEMEALDEEIEVGPLREGQQSRISKKLTIKDYIALEKENKKLREMISTFTREAERMQEKLLSWTKTFKSFSEPKKSPPKKLEPAPQKVYQTPPTPKRRRHTRLPTVPKVSKSPGVENDKVGIDIPYIKRTSKVVNIPEFPITNIRELIDLEKKMREKSYFSNVFDIIYVSFKKSNVHKSVSTLLNHIVNSELFKFFVWKDLPLGRKRLKMVDFPKFISLFLSLSVKLFGLNQEPKSLELAVKQVLHSHITNANRRNQPNYGPPVVQHLETPQTSLVVLNYDLNRSSEHPQQEVKTQSVEDQRISLSEEDMEKYFTPETHLAEDDDDIEDITPAPVSIDIVDDSD